MNKILRIKFIIFLIATCYFFLLCGRSNAQRAAGQSPLVSGAENIAEAALPFAQHAYKRMESRSGMMHGISNAVAEAKPFIERAVPIAQKGVRIGKKILKILKKILR